ncbi:MAG: DnaD domain protein [Anaerolineales bacterium]|nr:DnaD domain protein [Anaerolineales bacterium]
MSDTSQSFPGFPEGKTRLTPIPSAFFTELLPAIDDLAELKVTLYVFWVLGRRDRTRPYVTLDDILSDERLLDGLPDRGARPEEVLEAALERAVQRGTLLHAELSSDENHDDLYFVNTARGRETARKLEQGTWKPDASRSGPQLKMERPNVFNLYESNIGPLTPMIAERLQEAERTYPGHWIEDAMRIAVENNARKWRYVEAILEDWNTKGRDEREDRGDTETARRRYVEGEFADHIEH